MSEAYTRFGVTWASVTSEQPLTNDADNYNLSDDIAIPTDTEVNLVLKLTGSEYTKILSSCINGANRFYPDEYLQVIYPLLRAGKLDFCEQTAECITNNATVVSALAEQLSGNPVMLSALQRAINQLSVNNYLNENRLPSGVLSENLIDGSSLCTNQNRYAIALAIVRAMDTLSNDFLEIIEVLTNPNEIAGEIAASIPVFGQGLSLTSQAAAWLQDNIKENYNAAYNSTSEREIACEIYCIMDGECDVNFNDILQAYYNVGTISPPSGETFAETMSWLITNVTPSLDEIVVAAMHTFILYCVEFSNEWIGTDFFNYIKQEAYNARDEEVAVPPECQCANPPIQLVIGRQLTPCPTYASGGSPNGVLEWLGGNNWRATAQGASGGWTLNVQRADGQIFYITNLVQISGTNPPFRIYCNGQSVFVGGSFNQIPQNISMYGFQVTGGSVAPIQYEFSVYEL